MISTSAFGGLRHLEEPGWEICPTELRAVDLPDLGPRTIETLERFFTQDDAVLTAFRFEKTSLFIPNFPDLFPKGPKGLPRVQIKVRGFGNVILDLVRGEKQCEAPALARGLSLELDAVDSDDGIWTLFNGFAADLCVVETAESRKVLPTIWVKKGSNPGFLGSKAIDEFAKKIEHAVERIKKIIALFSVGKLDLVCDPSVRNDCLPNGLTPESDVISQSPDFLDTQVPPEM